MKDSSEATPLMLAAERGNVRVLRQLVVAGASVSARDANGETSLHYALRGLQLDAMRFLVEQKGASHVLKTDDESFSNLLEKRTRRLSDTDRCAFEQLTQPVFDSRAILSPTMVSVHVATPDKCSRLGQLFPDAVTDEIPQLHEISSVSGLIFCHTFGSLARWAGNPNPKQSKACQDGMHKLESLRFVRELGHGAVSRVIEVEEVLDSPASMSLLARTLTFSLGQSEVSTPKEGNPRYAMKLQLKVLRQAGWQASSELLALRRAAHPFIVRLEAAFQTPQYYALLLELCTGGDLTGLITSSPDANGRCVGLPSMLTAKLMGQVLLALVFLHETLGVVYRDMKPDNVLITAGKNAKLADFGLAARVGDAPRRNMAVVGTMGFLAPELIFGEWDSDSDGPETLGLLDPFKTDAYSFGVTLQITLLGEDGADWTDEWLVPRAGTEAEIMKMLEDVMQRRNMPQGLHLLKLLLSNKPQHRAALADPTVLNHAFFLENLEIKTLTSLIEA